MRASGIGTIIGALPGTGGDIAALLAYDDAKRSTKNPKVPFGEGAKEGLIAPEAVLIPLIIALSAVGTYAIQNNPSHIYWMLGFGVFDYFLKTYGFQVGPVILGVILGPMMDSM